VNRLLTPDAVAHEARHKHAAHFAVRGDFSWTAPEMRSFTGSAKWNSRWPSSADHNAGFNLAKNAEYQREYEAGVKSFNAGRYADAMQHLSNADKIVRSRPNWTHAD
jgi:hypothetical protein